MVLGEGCPFIVLVVCDNQEARVRIFKGERLLDPELRCPKLTFLCTLSLLSANRKLAYIFSAGYNVVGVLDKNASEIFI